MRSLAIAIVVLAISGGLASAEPVSGASEPMLTVRGQGRVQVPPDHANLAVDVVTKGKSPDAAASAHRERATRAAGALRGMKINGVEIESSVFRLDEVRQPPGPQAVPGRNVETEYRAVTSFELKITRLDTVDATITAIAATGLFEVHNLRFGIEERNPAINDARKNAVDDARERAATYAKAAGVKLGDIVKIEDIESQGLPRFAAAVPLAGSVQVTPPEALTLSASVTMTWRIAP